MSLQPFAEREGAVVMNAARQVVRLVIELDIN
jgi:hypothetical protein